MGYKITKKSLINGLKNVSFPGRLEKFHLKNIPVFLDGAHNVAGADILYDFFKKNKKERWLIIGMMNNKDLENFLIRLKEIISGVIALKIPGEKNSFSTNKIIKICEKNNIICKKKQNIKMANSYLLNYIKPEEILVTGSLYLLGKVRKLYRK